MYKYNKRHKIVMVNKIPKVSLLFLLNFLPLIFLFSYIGFILIYIYLLKLVSLLVVFGVRDESSFGQVFIS